jgi:hypothetical protein
MMGETMSSLFWSWVPFFTLFLPVCFVCGLLCIVGQVRREGMRMRRGGKLPMDREDIRSRKGRNRRLFKKKKKRKKETSHLTVRERSQPTRVEID